MYWVLYIAWLAIKRPSVHELVFGGFPFTGAGLEQRAKALEAARGIPHQRTLQRIKRVIITLKSSGMRISQQATHEAIDEAFTELYFGGFANRFAAWRQMRFPLNAVFYLNALFGWFYTWSMIYWVNYIGQPFEPRMIWISLGWSLAFFVLVLVLGFIINGGLFLVLLLLSAAVPNKPTFVRAYSVLDEMFRSMRAAKRKEKMIEE